MKDLNAKDGVRSFCRQLGIALEILFQIIWKVIWNDPRGVCGARYAQDYRGRWAFS